MEAARKKESGRDKSEIHHSSNFKLIVETKAGHQKKQKKIRRIIRHTTDIYIECSMYGVYVKSLTHLRARDTKKRKKKSGGIKKIKNHKKRN